ncbi:MAG: hypothetical protein PVJ38_08495, partial [Candidatus Bathyarchaeota archaeon]
MRLHKVPLDLKPNITSKTVAYLLSTIIYVMFLASIFFIHEVDRIPPDGYFLLNNLPLTYWIGIISLVALAYYT